MQIVEVKNNLVKVSYDTTQENLILSGFVVIKDAIKSFIGQIIHLESNSKGNFAVVKLLFIFNAEGVISSYNGSIPDAKCLIEIVNSQEILELFTSENPFLLGELAQQNIALSLDRRFFEDKLLICSEKQDDNDLLVNNFAVQLAKQGKKVLVFDLEGTLDFSKNKVTSTEEFKLPLNYDSINFIYNQLEDASSETKAIIQEVFLEVQNYVKSLPEQFIPFETFKDVVDKQYEEIELVELILLKNKLLKYYEEGIFAQSKSEFVSLQNSLEKNEPTIFDLSKVEDKIQRQMISYVYSLINQLDNEIYIIVNVNNSNSDKKLLKQIFTVKQTYSILICSYSYKYLKELKQLSKNLIFFAPIQKQDDFGTYNVFLSKLNQHEFIVYGQLTHNIPFIVKLAKISEPVSEIVEESKTEEQAHQEDSLYEEIKRDVDEIYTAPKKEGTKEDFDAEIMPDELTEEDLDFIEEEIIDETGKSEQDSTGVEEKIIDELEEEKQINENVEEEEEVSASFSEVMNQQAQEETLQESPVDILPASISSTPIVPIYSAEIESKVQSDKIGQGDIITHPKYGKGMVEKLISYGSKTLYSINFDNVGRRLLDPNLAEIKKLEEE